MARSGNVSGTKKRPSNGFSPLAGIRVVASFKSDPSYNRQGLGSFSPLTGIKVMASLRLHLTVSLFPFNCFSPLAGIKVVARR